MAGPWPRPGWTPIEPFPFREAGHPFAGLLTRDPKFLGLRYFKKPDGALAAVATFGPLSEGAPGRAHGGATLSALDEALGAAAWVAGHPVLTSKLSVEFRRGVPLGAELLIEPRLGSVRHRVVPVTGSLVGADGTLYASAEGRFFELGAAAQVELLGRRS